jgi:hypothetical protein
LSKSDTTSIPLLRANFQQEYEEFLPAKLPAAGGGFRKNFLWKNHAGNYIMEVKTFET